MRVFITGASSGLGEGLALHYARAGAVIGLCARRAPLLAELAEKIRALGANAHVYAADVGNIELTVAPDITVALIALILAGAADMISGIFRDLLWKQTIPDALRGRLAGVELLSYAVGPSAGQLRAGTVASLTSPRIALTSGGVLCVVTVSLVCLAFPGFTAYRAPPITESDQEEQLQLL